MDAKITKLMQLITDKETKSNKDSYIHANQLSQKNKQNAETIK